MGSAKGAKIRYSNLKRLNYCLKDKVKKATASVHMQNFVAIFLAVKFNI